MCVCGLSFVLQDSADKTAAAAVSCFDAVITREEYIHPIRVCINTIISEDPLQAIYDLQILKAWMHHLLNCILFHSSTNTNKPCLRLYLVPIAP